MLKKSSLTSLLLLVGANLTIVSIDVKAEQVGPSPYLSQADSPFNGINFKWFYLENFEDGLLNTPGVTAVNNAPGGSVLGVYAPPNQAIDSVDGDDGTIDGLGQNGHSFAALANDGGESFGHTYTFDAQILGSLPTHVGIVWTDGSRTASTQFEAFDVNGNSLGVLGPIKIGDNSFFGTTGEDRFFGAINETGISRFILRDPNGTNTLEVDHLQYGSTVVPLPGAIWYFSSALIGLLGSLKIRAFNKAN